MVELQQEVAEATAAAAGGEEEGAEGGGAAGKGVALGGADLFADDAFFGGLTNFGRHALGFTFSFCGCERVGYSPPDPITTNPSPRTPPRNPRPVSTHTTQIQSLPTPSLLHDPRHRRLCPAVPHAGVVGPRGRGRRPRVQGGRGGKGHGQQVGDYFFVTASERERVCGGGGHCHPITPKQSLR